MLNFWFRKDGARPIARVVKGPSRCLVFWLYQKPGRHAVGKTAPLQFAMGVAGYNESDSLSEHETEEGIMAKKRRKPRKRKQQKQQMSYYERQQRRYQIILTVVGVLLVISFLITLVAVR